jgi:hypothetical protein
MKTRAFDPIENRWRTDYVVTPDGKICMMTAGKDFFFDKSIILIPQPDWKLSRFAGQLDEDDTEIYEHSIVECCIMEDINSDEGIVWGPTVRDMVVFDTETGMFRLSKHKGIPLVQHSLVEFMEVVGDVFTTPELLEEVNK